jgi:hypothetical protein
MRLTRIILKLLNIHRDGSRKGNLTSSEPKNDCTNILAEIKCTEKNYLLE